MLAFFLPTGLNDAEILARFMGCIAIVAKDLADLRKEDASVNELYHQLDNTFGIMDSPVTAEGYAFFEKYVFKELMGLSAQQIDHHLRIVMSR